MATNHNDNYCPKWLYIIVIGMQISIHHNLNIGLHSSYCISSIDWLIDWFVEEWNCKKYWNMYIFIYVHFFTKDLE